MEHAGEVVQVIGHVADRIISQSQFGCGAVFAATICLILFWLTGGERTAFGRLQVEREKELNRQNQLKDERINELHRTIAQKDSNLNELRSEMQTEVNNLRAELESTKSMLHGGSR